MTNTIAANIETLRAAFGAVDRMDPAGKAYDGICTLLDNCDDEALKAVHAAQIKFVSQLALNRMVRRGLTQPAPSMDVHLIPSGRNRYRAIKR